VGLSAKEPLTIARLETWAERLRGAEKPPVAAAAAPIGINELAAEAAPVVEEAPIPEPVPVRAIRPEDLITVGRKPAEPAVLPEPPAVPKPPFARPALEVVAGRSRFSLGKVPSSSGVRFILLCLAAFFLSAGAVHSFTRWKQTRVIVVPVPAAPGSVIT
jgi:hypothetical protein